MICPPPHNGQFAPQPYREHARLRGLEALLAPRRELCLREPLRRERVVERRQRVEHLVRLSE
jgi:hypothetical protein